LKEKSEVGQIIQNFCKLVQTQFHTQIQVFRTNNGTKFFNKIVGNFFLENGILHQSSCVNSPQQNGIVERKKQHLLEVARALLFSINVPKYLWGEVVLTAAHLINRMSSNVLKFQTPSQSFLKYF